LGGFERGVRGLGGVKRVWWLSGRWVARGPGEWRGAGEREGGGCGSPPLPPPPPPAPARARAPAPAAPRTRPASSSGGCPPPPVVCLVGCGGRVRRRRAAGALRAAPQRRRGTHRESPPNPACGGGGGSSGRTSAARWIWAWILPISVRMPVDVTSAVQAPLEMAVAANSMHSLDCDGRGFGRGLGGFLEVLGFGEGEQVFWGGGL